VHRCSYSELATSAMQPNDKRPYALDVIKTFRLEQKCND
jgi:hypothetical protein